MEEPRTVKKYWDKKKKQMKKTLGSSIWGKDKILCDCPCPGPFCNSFVHPCQKPNEHIPQIEEAGKEIWDLAFHQGQIEQLKELIYGPHVNFGTDPTTMTSYVKVEDLQTKLKSLESK